MFSQQELNALLAKIKDELQQDSGTPDRGSNGANGGGTGGTGSNGLFPEITAARSVVIAGLLTGALELNSVLVDKDQEVQIVLSGSLKRKTPVDKVWDTIGPMPFDTVFRSILDRFG